MQRLRCPKCGRFASKLPDKERVKYVGTYSYGVPNSTVVEARYGCWVNCSKCGYVDP